MARPTSLWLAAPSRFAGLRKRRASFAFGLLAIFLLLCMSALAVPDPAPVAAGGASGGQTDLMLYEKIVAAVKSGENYYEAAADALRSGSYPLRPFLTFRLPALAVILASVPPWAAAAMLFALAAAVALAWGGRLAQALSRPLPRIVVAFLLLGSMLAFLQPGLVAFHEIWAGLIVALSLALRRRERWIEAVAFGVVAMLIRETAALYAVVMALMAWIEGERREALGWTLALGLFGAVLGMHAYAAGNVTGPLDPASPGWGGLLGFGFFVKALTLATALQLLPLAAGALLVGLALFGWASWNDPLGLRMVAIVAAYASAIGIFARLDTFYWALIVAPAFLAGLVFVPDGLRDLARQALDKRRITVTRVAR
jgi:uncharacterized membrane protein (DUF485 family)